MCPARSGPKEYHVFLASPGDVDSERQDVREFFDLYNDAFSETWNATFRILEWHTHSTTGVGRPQALITKQTLERHKSTLALVVGILRERFGSSTGEFASGTEEELSWALESRKTTGFPEIKIFFRRTDTLTVSADPTKARNSINQWEKVLSFRKRLENLIRPVYYAEYQSGRFREVFDRDLLIWLSDPNRPWAQERSPNAIGGAPANALYIGFDSESYRTALLKQFSKLSFDSLDKAGAISDSVALWNVFVLQSVRETQRHAPRLLEISKEHHQRLLDSADDHDDADNEHQLDKLRREYLRQPRRPVLEVIDDGAQRHGSQSSHRVVVLGEPGSGKSSLIRYLALRWARIPDEQMRNALPIPIVIDLNSYGRWRCTGRKDFIRFLEEAPTWYAWPPGLATQLCRQVGRTVVLLDGLDEIFESADHEDVMSDIERFSNEYPHAAMIVTARLAGYKRLNDTQFRHVILQDLDAGQVDVFLDRWHEQTYDDIAIARQKSERLKRAIKHSKALSTLSGNPLLLTLMAILNRHQELPHDRVELYEQAARVLVQDWDTDRALAHFPNLSSEIGQREKTDILRRIASFMQGQPGGLAGNFIDAVDLVRLIEDYLRTELRLEQARSAGRAVVEHLLKRSFILCLADGGGYRFVHRTFLKYFCAANIVHQFNIAQSLSESSLLALFEQHCRDDEWQEILTLVSAQIDGPFVGRIIDRLEGLTELSAWDGKQPLPELVLAVRCLSEVRGRIRLSDVGSRLLKRLVAVSVLADSGPKVRQFLLADLAGAVSSLGARWPGADDQLQVLVKSGEHRFRHSEVGARFWVRLVASVTNDRDLVTELATQESDGHTSNLYSACAYEVLAEQWPDDTTRGFLAERAVRDQDALDRMAALKSLVRAWPDAEIRDLLVSRSSQDEVAAVRRSALRWLLTYWSGDATSALLTERARRDGVAAAVAGGQHSRLGAIVFSKALDGQMPYLDPREPVSQLHLAQAAQAARVPTSELAETVASLSEHLGWDITRGAGAG